MSQESKQIAGKVSGQDQFDDWYLVGLAMGVYSWEDLPEDAHKQCNCQIKIRKDTPAAALLSGFRIGRSRRNYAQR